MYKSFSCGMYHYKYHIIMIATFNCFLVLSINNAFWIRWDMWSDTRQHSGRISILVQSVHTSTAQQHANVQGSDLGINYVLLIFLFVRGCPLGILLGIHIFIYWILISKLKVNGRKANNFISEKTVSLKTLITSLALFVSDLKYQMKVLQVELHQSYY